MRGRLAVLGLALLIAPWATPGRADEREPCAEHSVTRRPYFGDLHVHTALSYDASALGVRTTPRQAYRFARGQRIGLQPFDAEGHPLRHAQLDRPLDFAAVTDHAELLGEVRLCETPGAPGNDSLICVLTRRWPLLAYYVVNSAIFNVSDPRRYSFCGEDGHICREAALEPWREIQQAAEEAYDRSGACAFTTFVGYEWTPNPDSNMIHRNVIFRNRHVPARPTSYLEVPTAEGLWDSIDHECIDADLGCDAIVIPHNSNLSGGWMFKTTRDDGQPLDAATARQRARLERLVEVIQHKGASECRETGPAADELCAFERLPFARMDEYPLRGLWTEPPQGSYVREAWTEGMRQRRRLGIDPFRFGLIASTDTHLGTPGLVDEKGFPGHAAGGDTSRLEVPRVPDRPMFNPGGLAVLWAEENSRDALFEAMRRREAYATSGPRMVVRVYAGWELDEALCSRPDFAARGDAAGVPMGGVLPARPAGAGPPRIAVSALADPGLDAGHPGIPLERVQIVKLSLAGEESRESVYDVAGGGLEARVDLDTCTPHGAGYTSLCQMWTDPDFDPSEPAVYYARVLENPSCRWTGWLCAENHVRCEAGSSPPRELAFCCDPSVPRTLQERAWTSPVWYDPDARAPDGSGPPAAAQATP